MSVNVGPAYDLLWRYTKALSVALRHRDVGTWLHSERVLNLAMALGERCGLTQDQLNLLKIAASFHDVGKIGIADAILLKPSALDKAEWAAIKEHSEFGEGIIAATEIEGSQQAARIIRHHHEYFNGEGYPDGLAGGDIPVCSRIISIVDSYDAMSAARAYHRSRTHSEVMGILREETGAKHDPALMSAFSELIEDNQFKAATS